MAYNRRNKLRTIKHVQDVYKLHTEQGLSFTYIFKHHLEPMFRISRATAYNYLATNVPQQLRELERRAAPQPQLFEGAQAVA